ncbi:MAG: 2-polyprenylphenol 6-hydroxylase [Nitrospinae bacterium]|nr:2-polyprenylphenol 6-hydroxylase [Nitrospinota bacterium]MBI3813987.1 2-polyprenylphenol 6-hydroxylase [Nitrospinota bacterium]
MPFPSVKRTYQNIQRLKDIANVLIKHGFGSLIDQLNLQHYISLGKRMIPFKKYELEREVHTVPERLRLAFEELGPTFIKLGQVLSSRPDLIPQDFAEEFRKLQDAVPPFSASEAKRHIEDELHAPLDKIFSSFDDVPSAAASIAQVHNVTLLTGERVIVKVQRPGLREKLTSDISILFYLASLIEKYLPHGKVYNPAGIVEEFSKTIKRELNFNLEGSNAAKFKENFEGDGTVYIPKVFWEYTTNDILTMERIEGIPIHEIKKIEEAGHDKKIIAKNGVNAFLKQILEFGLFHADPHPGNFLIMQDGRIGIVDFGIVGRADEDVMESLANTFLSIIDLDYDRLVSEYIRLGLLNEDIDIKAFKSDLRDLIEPYYGKALKQIQAGKVLSEILHLAINYKARVPNDLILLGKTLITIEGLARALDPDILILEEAKPFAMELIKKRLSPTYQIAKAYRTLSDLSDIIKDIPGQLSYVLKKVMKDKLKIEFVHSGLDRLIRDMDKSSNRLSFALIISAIVVGSSIIMLSGKGPLLFGFPMLGVIGYIVAGLLGLWLVISILRSGRL